MSRVKRPVDSQIADVSTADVISRATSGFGRSRHFPSFRTRLSWFLSCATFLTLTITTSGLPTSGSGVFPVPSYPNENNIAVIDSIG